MNRWTALIATVATGWTALAVQPAAAIPPDDGCIRSPEVSTNARFDLYPVFNGQARAVTVPATLTVAVSRTECADQSFVNLRVQAHEPLVALPFMCESSASVRQEGKTYYAYLQGTLGPGNCVGLPAEGNSYPALPNDYDEGLPLFDPAGALEVAFAPAAWSLGPASPAPGGTVRSAPSARPVVLALPARRERERVVEFRHDGLDHYFVTADPVEAAFLDSLGSEGGWRRTGLSFPARGTTRVCRFYGSVHPGPNAHFFALEGPTCDFLRRLQAETPPDRPRWNFEGFSFFATPPDAENRCPASTIPVYRAYNDGFARGIDSNHRYATDRATFADDVRRGWVVEGVAFCVPG